jgi:hypothetical protein
MYLAQRSEVLPARGGAERAARSHPITVHPAAVLSRIRARHRTTHASVTSETGRSSRPQRTRFVVQSGLSARVGAAHAVWAAAQTGSPLATGVRARDACLQSVRA